mmetsp:Transcript_135936/g.378874  ORF Transcript_135936/g.378874 Transcript_135936/m.378874 type:complete len:636 (+) Transcript_135936:170-2077(+)
MTRKVKPCVTIPYWKILQDREGEKLEEEKESAKQVPQQETLLEVMGQAAGGRKVDARRVELRRAEERAPKLDTKEDEKPGSRDQSDTDDTLIFESFDGTGQPGPKWVGHSSKGWWWHQASGLLYSESDRKYFVWAEHLQQHVEADPFHVPADEAGLSFRAEASSAGSAGTQPGRSVIIRDLVAAGQALRTPLQHLDRPAALFAVFQGSPGADSAEFYAKNLHTKLLRQLSQYRGFWSESRVRGTFQSALEALDHEFRVKHGEKARSQNCSCSAVLLLGARVFAAALGDCHATLFRSRCEGDALEAMPLTELGPEAAVDDTSAVALAWNGIVSAVGDSTLNAHKARAAEAAAVKDPGASAAVPQARAVASACGASDEEAFRAFRFAACQLNAQQFPLHCLVLCAGGDQSWRTGGGTGAGGGGSLFVHGTVRPFLAQRRPRAAAGATALQLSHAKAAEGDRAGPPAVGSSGAAAGAEGRARPAIALAVDFKAAQAADGEEERPAKRLRQVEGAGPARIRCRHILLKHRELRQPTDPVRRRRVERPREEAEAMLRGLLPALLADTGSFPQLARKHSECSSCLRGGEQAGDLGWVTRGGARGAGSVSREVEEAAFSLAVGELSDIVVSDAGVHLVQRIA